MGLSAPEDLLAAGKKPEAETSTVLSRFDYLKYDDVSVEKQAKLKSKIKEFEHLVETTLPNGRPKSLALTALEESWMWVGKSIRDEQVLERSAPVPTP